ncbi:hypothetical protein Tco_0058594 [Tanacetum coccineum]
MTTPCPTPFPATTPRAGVLVPFVIISDSHEEITTLPVRPAPPSSDRIPALSSYLLDSGDDSSDEDLSETAESLHSQTASTSVVHPPSTRHLPTSHVFARQPGKEISMPLGYIATMDRWRAAPPSTCHPLLPSEIPSSSSLPLPLLPSSSSPSPSLLLSLSPAVLPPPERIESVGDDIETLHASLAFAMQETMALRAKVGLLEQHDVVNRDSLRIARRRITRLELRAVYAEQESHVRQTGDEARTQRTDITEQDIEASRAKVEVVEQRVETLQVSLRAARMDVRYLIESREADRFEMAELRSKVAENASNKRKWEGNHGGSSSQQQNKEHKVIRAHTTGPSNKEGYAGNLPLCNK